MATNRIDILDSALLRPGRIDRKIEFPNPTVASRADIIGIHSRRMNLLRGINLLKVAEKMNNASGAECKAICTEAGTHAVLRHLIGAMLMASPLLFLFFPFLSASSVSSGMFALRERRIHVTQDDFDLAVAKVMKKDSDQNMSMTMLWK